MSDRERLAEALRRADHCHGLVTRDGTEDACGKPPVAIIDARAFEDGCYWPACAYHANRYGRGNVVPLAQMLAEARAGALREGYLISLRLQHELDPDHCGGECFRESDIRAALAAAEPDAGERDA